MTSEEHDIFPGVLNPRLSAQWIVENTDPGVIRIDTRAVESASEMICRSTHDQLKQLNFSECEVQPKTVDKAAVDWIFFVDSINFSFWSANGTHFLVTHNGKTYSGYFAACAAVNRALEQGIPLTSAEYMAQIDEQQLANIFRSDDDSIIPMLAERVEIIRQNGQILLEKFDGSFYNCIAHCAGNAQKLLKMIVENFPNFRDFAEYKGKKVSLLKRAQILVADIHNCQRDKDPAGTFADIASLTMFADYRVPQALAHLGVLRYSPAVLEMLASGKVLENGCQLEVQLRAFSIRACDVLLDNIQKFCASPQFSADPIVLERLREFTAVDVDVWLWLWRREHADEIECHVPFHRCRSIFY